MRISKDSVTSAQVPGGASAEVVIEIQDKLDRARRGRATAVIVAVVALLAVGKLTWSLTGLRAERLQAPPGCNPETDCCIECGQ